jgi:hypothetical protein
MLGFRPDALYSTNLPGWVAAGWRQTRRVTEMSLLLFSATMGIFDFGFSIFDFDLAGRDYL